MYTPEKLSEILGDDFSKDSIEILLRPIVTATCSATTFKEAHKAQEAAMWDTPEYEAAKLKMLELATTVDEFLYLVENSCQNAPLSEKAFEGAKQVATFDDVEGIRDFFESQGDNIFGWGEKYRWMTLCSDVCIKKVGETSDPAELLKVYEIAPEYSPAREAALEKCAPLLPLEAVVDLLKKEGEQMTDRELTILYKVIVTLD